MSALNFQSFNPNRKRADMGVDISKIKPGDEVTIKAKVLTVEPPGYDGDYSTRVEASGFQSWVRDTEIVSHTPKALVAGDRVFGVATKRDGVVIATHKDLSWVEFEDGKHEVVFPDQVERVS